MRQLAVAALRGRQGRVRREAALPDGRRARRPARRRRRSPGGRCSWASIAGTRRSRRSYARPHRAAGLPFNLLYRVNAGPAAARPLAATTPTMAAAACSARAATSSTSPAGSRARCPIARLVRCAPEGGLPLAAAAAVQPSRSTSRIGRSRRSSTAPGSAGLAKEYVEAHAGDRSGVLDDFRSLTLFDGRKRRVTRGRSGDKGHGAQFAHLRALIAGAGDPESPSGLDTMDVTLAALRAAASGAAVSTGALQST